MATAYAKDVLLHKEWKRPGPLQARIIRTSERSFRVEIKLYSQWLKENGLGYVMRWKDVDVNEIFFKLLARYNISNSFQPLLTEDERQMLSNAEQRAYMLWLNGADLKDYFSRTTVWKYNTEILKKPAQTCMPTAALRSCPWWTCASYWCQRTSYQFRTGRMIIRSGTGHVVRHFLTVVTGLIVWPTDAGVMAFNVWHGCPTVSI